jgi:hypothetical protein
MVSKIEKRYFSHITNKDGIEYEGLQYDSEMALKQGNDITWSSGGVVHRSWVESVEVILLEEVEIPVDFVNTSMAD